MSKLLSAFGVIATATLLAAAGVLGFAFQTGRLNPDRMNLIVEVMRGEHDDLFAAEETDDGAGDAADPVPTNKKSADALIEQFNARRLADAQLERAAANVAAMRQLLDAARADLVSAEEGFKQEKERWLAERRKLHEADKEEGFQREVTYMQNLPPMQAKSHLLQTWEKHPADAVRLIRAMPESKGKKVLSELKTEEELKVLHELLEQLRLIDVQEFAP